MSPARLILSSLRHYWRTHFAVVLGVAAATAVIGGALIVGDSVRASLTRMSLERLGGVDHALTSQRFFREDLVRDAFFQLNSSPIADVAPAIVLPGSLTARTTPDGNGEVRTRRAGGVQVYGIDPRFQMMMSRDDETTDNASQGQSLGTLETRAVLNRRAAEELGVAVGDQVSLVVEIPPSIPRDSLLGERNETVVEVPLTVAGIAEPESTQGRFGLNPSQQLPLNVFVSLRYLQRLLDLSALEPTPRDPTSRPARVNAIFVGMLGTGGETPLHQRTSPEAAAFLTERLAEALTLEDLTLRIAVNEDHGYFALESEQMILDSTTAAAGKRVADTMGLAISPVYVYLLNEIANLNAPDAYSMYPVVAGINFTDDPPFGPFEYVSEPEFPLADDEIVINDWLAEDLHATRGDRVRVEYFVVGDRGELPEETAEFRIAGVVKLTGAADDRGFTPEVKGITDVEGFDDWRQPFPLELDRVTLRDDEYWDPQDANRKAYRATPKVFMALDAAQARWQSRYGDLTSLRIAAGEGESLRETAGEFEAQLLDELSPAETGLVFQPVKFQGVQAAQGTTDFTGLFIGFSFFLILSAAILINLLFRLGIEQRFSQIGLLAAVGWSPASVRKAFLLEGLALVLIGGVIGTALSVGYAAVMIYGLKTWWVGAIGTRFLFLEVEPLTLLSGLSGAGILAMLVVWRAVRTTNQMSNRELLSGAIEPAATRDRIRNQSRTAIWLAWGATGVVVLLLIVALTGLLPQSEAFSGFSWQVVAFFVIGVAALTAGLAALAVWLNSDRAAAVKGRGAAAFARLSLRNAARRRARSVLTASLIASATFVIVAVAAGHRNPVSETPDPQSGNGGFVLVAEASIPLLYDLNTPDGRSQLGIDVSDEDAHLIETMRVAPFHVKRGEDASCLNLYRTRLPTILGVPQDVIDEFTASNRFKFANTSAEEPWRLLEADLETGNVPVLGDMNTLQYSLHLGVGGTLDVPGNDANLEVAGMLDGSIFQGVLLMSEENFHELFPREAGFAYFLIETPVENAAALSTLLETELSDSGFDAERVAQRLADFLAVQNTYLSTFLTLGGLGLLLGTLGLATVMLRNVLERRGELALMRAVGFKDTPLAEIVLWENALLMLWGIAAGAISAFVAMAPHLSTTGADVPWLNLAGMLAIVVVVGMLSAFAAVRAAVRTPILSTLRGD